VVGRAASRAIRIHTVSGPGRNIELEPIQGQPRGSEGAPRKSAFLSLSLNIRFFARKM
jgi:hypothetical protein